jgi:DNA-binding MarR family transcriptional regulator
MSQTNESQPIGYLLAQVCRLHHRRAHTVFDAIGLYRGQPPMLKALWEQEGRTHSELADRLHVTPATISKMIQRMEKAGFVVRKPDPHDERVSRVYLAENGRAIWSDVKQAMHEIEVETFADFTAEELASLCRFLNRIRENLEQATGEERSS